VSGTRETCQLPLLEWPPRTRTGAPVTSHQAEARVKADRTRNTHAQATLDLVILYGPGTSSQLAEHPHDHLHADYFQRREQIRRRLGELRDQVVPPLLESFQVAGVRELTWKAVEAGERNDRVGR